MVFEVANQTSGGYDETMLRKLLSGYNFPRVVIAILSLWLVGAVVLRTIEGSVNPDFDSMPKALWNLTVYLFSGLDSGMPQTASGKVVAAMVLMLSLGVVAVFSGSIASFLVEQRLGERRRMPGYELKEHIVVCNWNEKGIPLVRELHADIIRDKRPIVVISESDDAANLPVEEDFPEFHDVYLIKGDPTKTVVLNRANVAQSYSVIVLADPAEEHLADAKSILVAMSVRSICDSAQASKPYICVDGVSPQNVDHIRQAGADDVVSGADFAMMLLSQSALLHGLAAVYRDLLSVEAHSNEIYMVPIPQEFSGKTFAELGRAVFERRDPENPSVLIGIKSCRGLVVNPVNREEATLEEGDLAVVIAWERPKSLV